MLNVNLFSWVFHVKLNGFENRLTCRLVSKSAPALLSKNDALNRFDHYERKVDDIEAAVESYDLGSKSLADEIAGLASDEKVDDELAQLKAKMKSKQK